MSIADKITQLTTIRGDIRTALAGKGVSASDHDFADFATDIGSISTGGLPSEYEAVDYIESSGTQYIDTGYVPNSTDYVQTDCYVYSTNSGERYPFGVRGVYSNWVYTNSLAAAFHIDSNQRLHSMRYTSERYTTYTGLFDKKITIISAPNYLLGVPREVGNNTLRQTSTNATPNQPEYSLYIFGVNNNNTGATALISMRLYRLWISNISGEILRFYVPCVRTADSKAGLYDLVNGVFYTNAGTGDFIIPT